MKFILALFATLLSFALSRPGGFGAVVPATSEEQKLLDDVRGATELQLDEKFSKFEAVSYVSQIVAGTNYIIAADTGDEVLHVKLHKPLPFRGDKPILMMVLRGKTLASPINPEEFV